MNKEQRDKYIAEEIERLTMTKEKLLLKLKECQENDDREYAHVDADMALLEYINDQDIINAFTALTRWYA